MISPEITIILDKPYKIKWTIKCVFEFEKEFKQSVHLGDITAETTVNRLYIMLRQTEPGITLDKVKELVETCPKGMGYALAISLNTFTAGQYPENPTKPAAIKQDRFVTSKKSTKSLSAFLRSLLIRFGN